MMGNLPVERLTPSRPFARCGIDFCGPISVYLRIRGKAPYKAYIAIFVCFATKAVHIEVVSDLTTDAFLASLKRMIGRRGLPTDIFCDNATNFVGACSKLAELKAFLFKKENQNVITNFCTNEFVNFHLIPPRAPHFGGIWEAAVKSAKGHLNRSIMNARLTYEELTTVLVEIEAVLNSRPISPLSSDPSDYEALTPGHFITGSALKSLPERAIANNINLVNKWTQITAIKREQSGPLTMQTLQRTLWFSSMRTMCRHSDGKLDVLQRPYLEKMLELEWSTYAPRRESFAALSTKLQFYQFESPFNGAGMLGHLTTHPASWRRSRTSKYLFTSYSIMYSFNCRILYL
ncbi:uncharacterized protein LOC118748926 [Rhagoletis pomonella]|nr:uncharacterized protein LOC118748926 [Rhagoletis pomonella]